MADEARVTQAPVVVLQQGESAARVSQAPVLVLADGSSAARLSQAALLVLAEGASPARISQAPLLILRRLSPGANLRIVARYSGPNYGSSRDEDTFTVTP